MPAINYSKIIEQNSPQFKQHNRTRQSIKDQSSHTFIQHSINCSVKQFSPRRSSLVTLRHTNNPSKSQNKSPNHTFYFQNVHKIHNSHQNVIDHTLQFLIKFKKSTQNQNKIINNRVTQIKNKIRHRQNYTKLPSPKNISQNAITLKPILNKINASNETQQRNLSNKFSTYHLPNIRVKKMFNVQLLYDKLKVDKQEQIKLLPQIINRQQVCMVNAQPVYRFNIDMII